MSTRTSLVLAGLAVVLMTLGVKDYRQNRKYEELQNQMAAQNAATKKLEGLQAKYDDEIRALYNAQLQHIKMLARMTDEALNALGQAAEMRLREVTGVWEQRLDDLKAASDAQHAADVARIAAMERALMAAGSGAPDGSDLATIWKENNAVVKIYVYSSFEFDRLTGISVDENGNLKFNTKKFRFEGVIGHLSGFVEEQKKNVDGSDEEYQYLWSASHIKDRDNSQPIKELWCAFRDDLNLQPEKVEIVGYDWRYDLSLLRFRKGFKFPGKAFRLGNMADVQPGDKVVAMGSPLDAQFAITEGEVMDVDYLGIEQGLTQPRILVHSAQITFGNSGGPLILKRTGEVVGVNVALMNKPGGYFMSTSVSDMKDMYPRLKNARGFEVLHSQLEHAAFVNSWRFNPPDWAGIGMKTVVERCVVTTEVMKDSVADKAGLVAGDIVLSWNGVVPKDDAHLWRMITNVVPSAVGTMMVKRGDEMKELKIALGIFKGSVFTHERYKLEEVPEKK
ncbi:MAG: trypsin-like peptidase domain-containing protein [bacterium]|nr:trypsin-like peptidase domain-containing protein [bacterium]